MNVIMGFTHLVLRKAGGLLPLRHRDNLLKVKLSAEQLLNLINDIMDLSKIEAGRLDVKPSTFPVARLVAICCEMVGPLRRSGVALTYEVGEGVGVVHTDEARLRQILINLLSNALKFTESGDVRVACSVERGSHLPSPPAPLPQGAEEGGGSRSEELYGTSHESRVTNHAAGEGLLVVAVSDTGIGIPSDALDYIFDEFRQVDGSSTRRYGGTGLGLSITKKLTELLGGTIAVESEVGKGSTFTVRIPMTYRET
jgi:signal transduction histidine kinase